MEVKEMDRGGERQGKRGEDQTSLDSFYRAMLRRARCHSKSSDHLSVCLSLCDVEVCF